MNGTMSWRRRRCANLADDHGANEGREDDAKHQLAGAGAEPRHQIRHLRGALVRLEHVAAAEAAADAEHGKQHREHAAELRHPELLSPAAR
ncbi:MAG: hypothetical protein R3A78_11905 [Polyangiales bacterium]